MAMDASEQILALRRAYRERATSHLERLRAELDRARRQLLEVTAELERQDAAQAEADALRQALDILVRDEGGARIDRERAARVAHAIRERRDTLEATRVDLESHIWQIEADVNVLRLAGLADEGPRLHEPDAGGEVTGA
jgi:ABC-type arginine transport system ATPase subunit